MSAGTGSGKAVNLTELARGIRARHRHLTVADVNDHRLTLAVNEEPYPWHAHPNSDELFVVLEGVLTIEFEGGVAVELGPMDTRVVPAGTVHRTIPRGRCVNVVFEIAGTETRWEQEGR